MKEVYEALVLAVDADSDLSTTFPNGLFNDTGFDSQGLPVLIVSGLSEVPTYMTCSTSIDEIRIQFTVFTTTDSQCFDALGYLKAEFDEKTLSMANTSCIRMGRVAATPPRKIDDAWRGTIDYLITKQDNP